MANTKSIQKVLNYLREKDVAVSPSQICSEAMLRYRTVKEILEILKMNGQIIILSTGKNTLIKFEEVKNG
ncbi:MAG: hypothetical protein KKF48_03020 [Nanoarchaeota archaeon]|nr:hypothetical protein [Nanoarchaeota archaeon]MBU1027995.1 hypothetical protein [Nanoarchaeota archaeon]